MKKALILLIAALLALPMAAQQRKGTTRRPAARKTAVRAPQKMMNAEELTNYLGSIVGEPFYEHSPLENYTIKTRLIKLLGQKKYKKIIDHYNTELQELEYVDGIFRAYGGTAHHVTWGTAWAYDPEMNVIHVGTNLFSDEESLLFYSEDDVEAPDSFYKFASGYVGTSYTPVE